MRLSKPPSGSSRLSCDERPLRPALVMQSLGVCLLASLVLFPLAMVCAYAIPGTWVRANVASSAELLADEGDYPRMVGRDNSFNLDNFTCAIMLNEAAHGSGDPLRNAMANPYWCSDYAEGMEGRHMGASLAEGLDREPDDDGHWVAYSHYWHGYLVVLKPLLCLCSLNQIRVLVVLVGAGLALAVTCRLARQVSFASGVAFGFSLVCVRLSVVLLSLPFAPSFLIALAGCLVILRADGHVRLDVTRIGLPALAALFLVVGALTAFFDFLDTPLVTLGLPLVLLVILMRASIDRATVMRAMRVVALCAVSWALGYGLLFVWKWLLAGLVLGPDAVSNALASFTHRVAAQADGEVAVAFTPLDAVHRNVTMLVSVIFLRWGRASTAEAIVPAALVCALVLASCVVRWRKGGAAVASAWFLVPLVLVSVMPYLWYVIVSGHSWVHAWFTYRTQVVTVCGVLMALAVMLGRHPAETGGPAPLAADTPIPR